MERVAQATGWEALGLVPYFADARLLPAEDALALEQTHGSGTFPRRQESLRRVKIAVPILPHIANFDDLDPLAVEPAVDLEYVRPGAALPAMPISWCCPARRRRSRILRLCAAPASTSTSPRIGAAAVWSSASAAAIRCWRTIADPVGIEGPPATVEGLGLIDVATTLSDSKRLEPVRGSTSDGAAFAGYEMHMGVTAGPDCARPFARLADGTAEGAISPDGRVIGTYMHGLFADDRQRAAWLKRFAAGATKIAYGADRAHARCACRASGRASRSRLACSRWRDGRAAPRPASSAIRIASARR